MQYVVESNEECERVSRTVYVSMHLEMKIQSCSYRDGTSEVLSWLPSASVPAVAPLGISMAPRSVHPRDALIDSPTAAECAAAPAIRRHAPTDE